MHNNNDPLAITDWVGGNFEKELPAVGEHQAVCCQIHNLGFQEYKGKVSPSPKCVLVFELDEKLKNGEYAGKPMIMSENYNMFMGPDSKLRKALESWRGKAYTPDAADGFTLRQVLHKPCTLMVAHEKKQDGTMKAKIVGIIPPKGPAVAVTYTETPQWILDTQAKAVQPKATAMAGGGSAPGEEGLPF